MNVGVASTASARCGCKTMRLGAERCGYGRRESSRRVNSSSSSFSPLLPEVRRTGQRRRSKVVWRASPGEASWLSEVADNVVFQNLAAVLNQGGQVALHVLPSPLDNIVSTLIFDLSNAFLGEITSLALLHFFAVYYFVFANPKPIIGFLDYYIVGPIDALIRNSGLDQRDFKLRGTLGGGNFGTIYEAVRLKKGEEDSDLADLSEREEEARKVVMKRIKKDNLGVRKDFLAQGTMAQGTEETGLAEAFFCQRIKRNPLAAKHCATFLGEFVADEFGRGYDKDSQWLVFKYESEITLADTIEGRIGPYPECLEDFSNNRSEAGMIKKIMKELLEGISALNTMGIVHRDIKPENILLTERGDVKLIDFGAAADLCTGVNFNPKTGFLDPRYCPPEEFVVPQNFPRAPIAALSTLASPLVWNYTKPGLFDVYAVGIIFLQMTVPQMRKANFFRTFQREMKKFDYDLQEWRRSKASSASQADFSELDTKFGSGWDLACKMISLKSKRISAKAALRHPYFLIL
ncbi:protein kinase [Chloropicon primus]|uniref:Protein kinase n=1 Tax=Chloropicon primus TaxID=1764295 RepID=A0A5B8MEX3_9CHLO|nr:protein kinase [Chloropicon primus]UPQ98396.1 protein kinase [Chloropicon primus]|eukprot:QDZ19188.1 protein kinase [Chloropicon primus]